MKVEKQTKILVIDDHPLFLEGMKLGLESLSGKPFVVETLNSTLEALKCLTHIQGYDLILCDLNIPEMSGIAFIDSLIKQDVWVRIAIISASENPGDITNSLSAGAAGFINKSIKKLELIEALSNILDGNSYVPESYNLLADRSCMDRFGQLPDPDRGVEAVKLGITYRQFEVLKLISQGLTNKDISARLEIKVCTIKSHVQALFQILNVKNRTACSVAAKKLKLLPQANFGY